MRRLPTLFSRSHQTLFAWNKEKAFRSGHYGDTSCWRPTKRRPHGGGVSQPYSPPSPLKPTMVGKTVTQWLTRGSVGGLDIGALKGSTAERLKNFPWYLFPVSLRDRSLEEIYHRAYVLHEKEAKKAFDLVQRIP
ncbi:unnamed protein product [Amoebophrya sp. A120]|nr:unnamed protein product [Amoebophrya sp. A120]|eukprot:GSA120T00008807001.1